MQPFTEGNRGDSTCLTFESFGVCCKMLHVFCKSVVKSVISSAIMPWDISIRVNYFKKLHKMMEIDFVLGMPLEPLEMISQIKRFFSEKEHFG